MRQQFLPSGRVQYFPQAGYTGNGQFTTSSGEQFSVTVKRKIVDATFSDSAIPATHPPRYEIEEGVLCVPINELPSQAGKHDHYVIVGSGKTGIDACQWLLENNIPPEKIRWIAPRDCWLLNRRNFQPGDEFFNDRVGGAATQMETVQRAESIEHLFQLLEEQEVLLRLDANVVPTAYRCATVTKLELEALRTIKDVVRLGRIKRITNTAIELEKGQVDARKNTLYIDCSAMGITEKSPLPVFNDNVITIQGVRTCQPCLSAALIAFVDTLYESNEEKNQLCQVVPYPRLPKDWITMTLQNAQNHQLASQDERIRNWMAKCRLDPSAKAIHKSDITPEQLQQQKAISQRLKDSFAPALEKLHRLASANGLL